MMSRPLGAEEGVQHSISQVPGGYKDETGKRSLVNEEMEMSLLSVVTKKWLDDWR